MNKTITILNPEILNAGIMVKGRGKKERRIT
jgi:hypothetical protein